MRWRALSAAEVAIYPVHARGLVDQIVNPRDPGGGSTASLRGELDGLSWVAEQTGGRSFANRNDLDESVHQALDDGDVVYTLGFYSQRDKPDEKFHELKVKVERQGVEVRSRAGYFDREAKADGDSMTLLRRAADTPVDSSDIGLVAAMTREGSNFRVAVQVDFKDLLLEQQGAKWKGSANLAFVSQTADGRTLDLANKGITFDMTDEAYRARRRDGFAVEQLIPVREGTARIRVVFWIRPAHRVSFDRGALGQYCASTMTIKCFFARRPIDLRALWLIESKVSKCWSNAGINDSTSAAVEIIRGEAHSKAVGETRNVSSSGVLFDRGRTGGSRRAHRIPDYVSESRRIEVGSTAAVRRQGAAERTGDHLRGDTRTVDDNSSAPGLSGLPRRPAFDRSLTRAALSGNRILTA